MDPYKPKNLPEFEILRRRAQQQGSAQKQEQESAIQRRFASQGMLNSGAAIKTAQLASDEADKRTGEALQNVDMAEQQELQRQKEVQEARQFQTSERVASQDFAAGESSKQRLFSKDLFDQDMSFKKTVQADTVRFAELDHAYREKEFVENQKTNRFNMITAAKNAGLDQGAMDQFSNVLADFEQQLTFDSNGKATLHRRAGNEQGDYASVYHSALGNIKPEWGEQWANFANDYASKHGRVGTAAHQAFAEFQRRFPQALRGNPGGAGGLSRNPDGSFNAPMGVF